MDTHLNHHCTRIYRLLFTEGIMSTLLDALYRVCVWRWSLYLPLQMAGDFDFSLHLSATQYNVCVEL